MVWVCDFFLVTNENQIHSTIMDMKHGMTDWGVDASNNMHMETESPVFFQTPMTVCIVQRSFCTLAVVRTSLVRTVNTRTLSTTTARSVAMNIGSSRRYPRLELTERKIMMNIMYLIPSDLTIRKVIITPDCVQGGDPDIVRDPARPREKLGAKK